MNIWPDYSTQNSIHHLLMKLPSQEIQDLFQKIKLESLRRGMVYEESDGSKRLVPLLIRPRLIQSDQKNYFQQTCRVMNCVFKKITRLYLTQPDIQSVLPLPDEEKSWILRFAPKSNKIPQSLIMRWDANTDFSGTGWKKTFHFLEVNGVGVGGLHYGPTCESIIQNVIIQRLQKLDSSIHIKLNDDIRNILLCELKGHAKNLGISHPQIALVQECHEKGGPLDFQYLEKYFHRQGLSARVVDPRDLHLRNQEIYSGDHKINLIYRDTLVSEFIEMEKESGPLKAIRHAFQKHCVISDITGELDHKSIFEVMSHPDYSRFFTAGELGIFKKHIPWTRLIREIKTYIPNGRKMDLVSYVEKHKNDLVMKPNRSFGGEGVLFGNNCSESKWRLALNGALKNTGDYVVQEKCPIRKKIFPILKNHQVTEKRLHVVCGFIYSDHGLGILGRASAGQVVNVAKQGGMTAILVCEKSN